MNDSCLIMLENAYEWFMKEMDLSLRDEIIINEYCKAKKIQLE